MYKQNIEWLKQVNINLKEGSISEELKQRVSQVKSEIFEFEINAFEIIMNSINSELSQIDYINRVMQRSMSEDIKQYGDIEIQKHRNNITTYGNQVYSLFSRQDIISYYEKNRLSCQERIDFNKKELNDNPKNDVAMIALRNDEKDMVNIEHSISVLNGKAVELMDSYINNSEIGQKLL